jgi:hypothetical protein
MSKIAAIALIALVGATAIVSAQDAPPPVSGTVSIRGCVAPVLRDGSLAPKPGTGATPETAPMEANSNEPAGVFMLLDAKTTTTTQSRPVSFALSGHEPELTKLNGARVEITGSIVPTAHSTPSTTGGVKGDGMQRVRVESVKKLAGPACSAAKK